jgi:hypothetical protein
LGYRNSLCRLLRELTSTVSGLPSIVTWAVSGLSLGVTWAFSGLLAGCHQSLREPLVGCLQSSVGRIQPLIVAVSGPLIVAVSGPLIVAVSGPLIVAVSGPLVAAFSSYLWPLVGRLKWIRGPLEVDTWAVSGPLKVVTSQFLLLRARAHRGHNVFCTLFYTLVSRTNTLSWH